MPDEKRAMPHDAKDGPNHLLARLSASDYALLQPDLKPIELPLRMELERPHRLIDRVYFPASGFVSVVANGKPDASIEVGLIGREGMTGLAVVMGTDRSPHRTFVQSAGVGMQLSSHALRRALGKSQSLHHALLLYGHAFIIQATYTAVANARNKVEERLARWILMAHDRLRTDDMALTHEFLAIMLGVRRAGVTVALQVLQQSALIEARRGRVRVLDRQGLEKRSNGAYGEPEAEFQRLFG